MEFTIENQTLFMLQCRNGKRTARAQVVIAIDMVNEGLITPKDAIKRVSVDDVNTLLLPQLDTKEIEKAKSDGRWLAKGVNASPVPHPHTPHSCTPFFSSLFFCTLHCV